MVLLSKWSASDFPVPNPLRCSPRGRGSRRRQRCDPHQRWVGVSAPARHGRLPASGPRRRLLARSLGLALLAALIALAGVEPPGVRSTPAGAAARGGTATSQAMSVDEAEAAVREAGDIRGDAEDRVAEQRERASTLDQELSHKSDEVQDTVVRLAKAQEQAQRLAVDAYMQGAGDDELVTLFDAE